jgi:hypothetical protein
MRMRFCCYDPPAVAEFDTKLSRSRPSSPVSNSAHTGLAPRVEPGPASGYRDATSAATERTSCALAPAATSRR